MWAPETRQLDDPDFTVPYALHQKNAAVLWSSCPVVTCSRIYYFNHPNTCPRWTSFTLAKVGLVRPGRKMAAESVRVDSGVARLESSGDLETFCQTVAEPPGLPVFLFVPVRP